jgi:hypothetical protein
MKQIAILKWIKGCVGQFCYGPFDVKNTLFSFAYYSRKATMKKNGKNGCILHMLWIMKY